MKFSYSSHPAKKHFAFGKKSERTERITTCKAQTREQKLLFSADNWEIGTQEKANEP